MKNKIPLFFCLSAAFIPVAQTGAGTEPSSRSQGVVTITEIPLEGSLSIISESAPYPEGSVTFSESQPENPPVLINESATYPDQRIEDGTLALSQRAGCHRTSCYGLYPNYMGCAAYTPNNAYLLYPGRPGFLQAYIELRASYSYSCDAKWGRVKNDSGQNAKVVGTTYSSSGSQSVMNDTSNGPIANGEQILTRMLYGEEIPASACGVSTLDLSYNGPLGGQYGECTGYY